MCADTALLYRAVNMVRIIILDVILSTYDCFVFFSELPAITGVFTRLISLYIVRLLATCIADREASMNSNTQLPDHLKQSLRALLLAKMDSNTLDIFELELFDWYVRETEVVLSNMLSSKRAYVDEQVASDIPNLNDSGIVAVEYYTKRVRYSHVIYLTSLLETCLERACSDLIIAMGKDNIPFGLNELIGGQWSKKRKFLERYGHFELPKDLWSELQVLTTVRNCLVHENGSTSNLSEGDRNAIKKQIGLDIESYEFKIEETYIRHACQAVRMFVEAVEHRVAEVIERAKCPKVVR